MIFYYKNLQIFKIVKHSLDAKCSNQEILACTKSKLKASFHNYLHLLHKYV